MRRLRGPRPGLARRPVPHSRDWSISRRPSRCRSAIARALEYPFEPPGVRIEEALRARLDALCDILPPSLLDGLARTIGLTIEPAVQVKSAQASGPGVRQQSGMPQQPLDPLSPVEGQDVVKEHDPGEFGDGCDGAGPDGAVDGVDQRPVAPRGAQDQFDQDFEP